MSTRPTCSDRVCKTLLIGRRRLHASVLLLSRHFFILSDVLRRQEELRRMEELYSQERQKRKEMQLRYIFSFVMSY